MSITDRALLDTSVIIDYPAETVARHARSVAVSTITLAELSYGLHTPDPVVNAAREQRFQWIRQTFEAVVFDAGAARAYGALCASVRTLGRDPKPRRFDMLIAAVALTSGVPLLTRNSADFAGIHHSLDIVAVE